MIITQEINTFLPKSEPHFDQSDRFIEARKPFDTKGYSPFRKHGVRRSERPSKGRYIGLTWGQIASSSWTWRPVEGSWSDWVAIRSGPLLKLKRPLFR